ncbi:hypothetical protein [Heyndrickxia coagulans]|uniref:hypothetical protein n=1 Tax=Heyndrickxia coagulans TaxID=1398 RepID=UPI000628805A|nr:hypothetical protein [Heyndrickxia coagulans]
MAILAFLEELKYLWETGQIPKWFTVKDVKKVTSNPEAKNLSNYCRDNSGSSNKNKKILFRRINKDGNYEYTF